MLPLAGLHSLAHIGSQDPNPRTPPPIRRATTVDDFDQVLDDSQSLQDRNRPTPTSTRRASTVLDFDELDDASQIRQDLGIRGATYLPLKS